MGTLYQNLHWINMQSIISKEIDVQEETRGPQHQLIGYGLGDNFNVLFG